MSMKRTTIMLPTELRLRALQHANDLGISLGELIRKSLLSVIHLGRSMSQKDPLFADKAVFRGSAPRDLSKNHDRYLYGDKTS